MALIENTSSTSFLDTNHFDESNFVDKSKNDNPTEQESNVRTNHSQSNDALSIKKSLSESNIHHVPCETHDATVDHKLADDVHRKCLEKCQMLEGVVSAKDIEIQRLKENCIDLDLHSKKKINEAEGHIINLRRQLEKAIKEKEQAVVRYAVSEKYIIDVKQLKKDCEVLESKLKRTLNEKARICALLDAKSHELLNANKEKDQVKADFDMLEYKMKTCISNYKLENEGRLLSEKKCESLRLQVDKLQANIQQIEQSSQDSQKLIIIEKQLTESQAQLILERHKLNDLETKYNEIYSSSHKASTERDIAQKAVIELTEKVKMLEANLEQMEVNHKEIRAKDLETTHKQIFEAQTTILNNEQEIERLRVLHDEVSNELTESHKKEVDLLQFTQVLTENNVLLQSKFSAMEAKILGHSAEENLLKAALDEQTKKVTDLQKEVHNVQAKYKDECKILVQHLATKTEALERVEMQLTESQGEVQVLKRKHAAVIKELNRELQQVKKMQPRDTQPWSETNGVNNKGSNSSLSSTEPSPSVSLNTQTNGHDAEVLVERILKLQRIKAKQAEKLDFLEEHCKALVAEIQNKTRVMQTLLLHANNSKSNSPIISDSLKEEPQMTLEMSLLINKNLQTVLEDTLLKNVALKENVDTLASEVMRLSKT